MICLLWYFAKQSSFGCEAKMDVAHSIDIMHPIFYAAFITYSDILFKTGR